MCDDIVDLLDRLSLAEKVSLLAGTDTWQTKEITRLGIGSLKTTDGPSGARGQCSVDGPTAAFLPGPVCQAATWSHKDVHRIGQLLSREAKTKSADILLAPTICCARNPLGGRNFECFGEDPFLSGSLAIEYVSGVQESGEIMATVKHFVANEQEAERYSINAIVSEKALREIYLKPFEMVIRSASPPSCVMTAYNGVNGLHMDMNGHLIQDILRGEWGFDGLVMSDWGGTNSVTESILAGCDLEMPGPPIKRGEKLLEDLKADHDPRLRSAVNASVLRVLSLAKKMKLIGLTESAAAATRHRVETSATNDEDIRLMRHVAASGIVLLKNSCQTLPLTASTLQSKQVAFIGPNAINGTPGGGGSATMNPQYLSQPMASFKAAATTKNIEITVKHSPGAVANKSLPLLDARQWKAGEKPLNPSGKSMIRVDFFASADLSGPVVETQFRDSSNVDLLDTAPASLQQTALPYSHRITSTIIPNTTGLHLFSVSSVGESRLSVDGEVLLDNHGWKEYGETFFGFGSIETRSSKHLSTSKSYEMVVESWTKPWNPGDRELIMGSAPSVRIGYQEQLPENMILDAVKLANESAYSIVVLGLDDEWESEGYDRQNMSLPGGQDELAFALLRQCERPESLIFVNQSGSPVEFPWVGLASTLIQAWYGGQEAGYALADILLGSTNPSGRLPVTWPRKYSDLPYAADPETWPGSGGNVHYREETKIGYRYYLQSGREPDFWFGYGLSYTEFSNILENVTETTDSWIFQVSVENQGTCSGEEVVQLYGWPTLEEDKKILVAFHKTGKLLDKQKEAVALTVRKRDLATWEGGKWHLGLGLYCFGICKHVGDAKGQVIKVNQKVPRTWLADQY